MVLRTLCSINCEKMFDTLSNSRVTEFEKNIYNERKAAISVYVIGQLSRVTSHSHRSLNFISVLLPSEHDNTTRCPA